VLNTETDRMILPKESEMAEEPKPLFNKDPEIIDEKIAFKPVEFEVPSFVPPPFAPEPVVEETILEPIAQPVAEPEKEDTAETVILQTPAPAAQPIAVQPVINTVEPIVEKAQPVEQAAPIPIQPEIMQMERPYSPTTGQNIDVIPAKKDKKSVVIYYLMLIILIGLSVLTLWLYQTKIDKAATPNLTLPDDAAPQQVAESVPLTEPLIPTEESAFIITESETHTPEESDFTEVIIEPPIFSEPVEITEQPLPEEEPLPMPEPEPMPADAEPLADDIITMPVESALAESVIEPISMEKPDYPVHGPAGYDGKDTTPALAQLCTSGAAPDQHGCCAGEDLRWVESYNGYGCCSVADGECYPPLR
jgi:hypothetical protein